MLKTVLIVYFISLYLSLPGFFSKAGYPALYGLIPIYNIYILVQILEIDPFILIILSLGLIFLNDRVFIGTLICIFLPFIIVDAYDKSQILGVLSFIIPFIIFPYIAYTNGTYCYDSEV